MPMARLKNGGASVTHDGVTYYVSNVYVELPDGVIAKLRNALPDDLDLLHKTPKAPIVAPASGKFQREE
jgi:hypothetical protein